MAAKTPWYDYPYLKNNRTIHILLRPNSHWMNHVSCVYRIKFGEKFYIGRTKQLYSRLCAHIRNINHAINQFPDCHPNFDYYGKLPQFILENEYINVGYIEVLCQCEDEYKLWYMENKYLADFKGNPDCLNRTFSNQRPNMEFQPLIQQRVYEYYRWFYNPKFDQELIEWDVISQSGRQRSLEKVTAKVEQYSIIQSFVDKYGKIY